MIGLYYFCDLKQETNFTALGTDLRNCLLIQFDHLATPNYFVLEDGGNMVKILVALRTFMYSLSKCAAKTHSKPAIMKLVVLFNT
jgi:hypothetical protein